MMTLRKRIATGLSAAALAFSSAACATTDTVASADTSGQAEVTQAGGNGPALWKVADEDTTIYIFGTVHALPSDVDWNSGPVQTALDSAGSLVTEIDMTPESMAAMGPMIMGKAMLPQDQTLRGLMNDDQRTRYEAGLAKMGIPAEALDRFEPWFAAVNIAQVMMQKAGFSGDAGVEKILEAAVKPDTKRVALETVEFQISVFDEQPMDQQIPYLLQAVEMPDEGVAVLKQIVEEWAEGDVEGLGSLLMMATAATPELNERLFYQRNANWAVWIDDRLDTPGTAFMAVGAGHLAGERSVQDYLGQRGIEVTRIQ